MSRLALPVLLCYKPCDCCECKECNYCSSLLKGVTGSFTVANEYRYHPHLPSLRTLCVALPFAG